MEESMKSSNSRSLGHLLIATLIFGSLWGLSEVVIGGSLRTTDFPYRSGLLTAIGMAVMAAAFASSRRPLMLVGIGVVAVLVTQLSVPILHVSPMCKANSCIALVIESASLGLVAAALLKRNTSTYARMGGGALAALLASVGFYFIGTRAVPCNYLLSFPTPLSFVVREGLVWAAFTAVLLPLGFLAGEKLAVRAVLVPRAGFAYYSAAIGVVALSWGASALAIMAGF